MIRRDATMRLSLLALGLLLVTAAGAAEPQLVIAPHIEGQDFCPQAVENPAVLFDVDAVTLCRAKDANAATRIAALLDAIGPAVSPSGHYALGYMIALRLASYFVEQDGAWVLDRAALRNDIAVIGAIDRPVVIYFSANHFTDSGAKLLDGLASDDRNLMWSPAGPLRPGGYFNLPVHAWTLADPDAPVTRLRREAVAAAMQEICRLDPAAQQRITAISLLGEVQQLYPDFFNGMGFSDSEPETDYSPASIAGFRHWLAERFDKIGALNQEIGGHFADFSGVAPPSQDVVAQSGDPLSHLSPSAAGSLAVYGWVFAGPGPAPLVTLYIDAQKVGEAPADLNRTDVPSADAAVTTPNVGYHFDYDYRALAPGGHVLELTATTGDGKVARFGFRRFTVAGAAAPSTAPRLEVPDAGPGLRAYIDGPADNATIRYNPLARLWQEYRAVQVRRYYESFAELAERSCLPADKFFSHEITPQLNASWNSGLMAVEAAQQPDRLYHPGTTLYGGAAFGDAFFRLKDALGWTVYGVSELHPTFDLPEASMVAMLERHRLAGARFVAPYYLDAVPAKVPRVKNTLYDWRITPENDRAGSAAFYRAIVDLMRHH